MIEIKINCHLIIEINVNLI